MDGFNAALPLYNLKKLTIEETKAMVGEPLTETFASLLGKEHAVDAVTIFRKRYQEIYLEKTDPLPHADETIKNLSRKGYSLAVATNKHGGFSRDIIRHLGWGEALTSVIGDGDTLHTKPEPDMIFKNLEAMSLEAGETIFIGDSPIDMETGNRAKIRTIGVPTGYHSKEELLDAGAEIVIDDLSQLEKVIK
jgi:phosphoglycolate phosphatase